MYIYSLLFRLSFSFIDVQYMWVVSSHIESILLDVGVRITVNNKMPWWILFVHACVVKKKKAFKWESVWIVVPRKQYKWFVLFFLLYGYQYRFIVRNTVHQVSARRAFSNVNPAFVPANRCFKQVLWDCCHVLVNPTTTIHGTFQQAWQVQQYFVLCFSVCKCFLG